MLEFLIVSLCFLYARSTAQAEGPGREITTPVNGVRCKQGRFSFKLGPSWIQLGLKTDVIHMPLLLLAVWTCVGTCVALALHLRGFV